MRIIHVYPVPCEYSYPKYLDPHLDPDAFDSEVMCHTDLEVRYLRGLHELGEDCTLLYPRQNRPSIKEFSHRGGYRIVRFPISFFEGKRGPLALGMLRYIRDKQPDLVHFHGIYGGGYLPLKMFDLVSGLCQRRSIPFFGWYHVGSLVLPGRGRWPFARRFYRAVRIHSLRRCAGITSINSSELERLFNRDHADYYGVDFGGIPHCLTPNTYDSEVFSPVPRAEARARLGLSPDGQYMLMVARLFREKGLHHLLNLMPHLLGQFPNVRLLVVGEFIQGTEEYRGEVESQLGRLGLRDRITFVGRVEHGQELRDYYGSADVFVLPTLKETFGGVNIEAMACGAPVVSTTCGEIPRYVTKASGLVVEPGDEDALLEALRCVLSGRFQTDDVARERILAQYEYRSSAKRLRDWYRDILADRSERKEIHCRPARSV
ncbi:glycosyltransferase [Verrucomicrobiota bacterium]